MKTIAAFIDRVLKNPDDETLQAEVKREVHALTKGFPLYADILSALEA